MPKAKSALTDMPPNNNGLELDPLIDALLEHLPAPGEYWAPDDRKLWLQILDLAFKLIYSEEQQPQATDEPFSQANVR